eukprot:TRINITY_DN353_c0_g2_i1.p1 TRINITY_DN353_c0_g2~~TRINITY_DN353_c0_g2_i1.p1  ORF type:complete len:484 (-),score=29.72 TRINITY_DN353_c0_g2_i1:203-1654(-)
MSILPAQPAETPAYNVPLDPNLVDASLLADVKWVVLGLAVAGVVISLPTALVGYRIYPLVYFIVAFVTFAAASAAVYILILNAAYRSPSTQYLPSVVPSWTVFLVAFSCGLSAGLIALSSASIATFVLGFAIAAAILTGIYFLSVAGAIAGTPHATVILISFVAVGMVAAVGCGLLSVKYRRAFVITASAVFGAVGTSVGSATVAAILLGKHYGYRSMLTFSLGESAAANWRPIVVYGGTVLVAVVGLLLQLFVVAPAVDRRNPMHADQLRYAAPLRRMHPSSAPSSGAGRRTPLLRGRVGDGPVVAVGVGHLSTYGTTSPESWQRVPQPPVSAADGRRSEGAMRQSMTQFPPRVSSVSLTRASRDTARQVAPGLASAESQTLGNVQAIPPFGEGHVEGPTVPANPSGNRSRASLLLDWARNRERGVDVGGGGVIYETTSRSGRSPASLRSWGPEGHADTDSLMAAGVPPTAPFDATNTWADL